MSTQDNKIDWLFHAKVRFNDYWHSIEAWVGNGSYVSNSWLARREFVPLQRHKNDDGQEFLFPTDRRGIIPSRSVWKHLRELVDSFYDYYDDNAITTANWETLSNSCRATRGTFRASSMKKGFVYLAKAGPLYKIGQSKNPASRIKQIQSLDGQQIVLVHTIETEDCVELEKSFHDRFSKKRVSGEWFDLAPDDVDFIKGVEQSLRPEWTRV